MSTIPPGWYDDPPNPGVLRYWDGTRWTEHRAPGVVGTTTTLSPRGASNNSTAMWAHLGPLLVYGLGVLTFGLLGLFAFAIPLIIMSSASARSPHVRAHAVESLNFQLSQLIYSIAALVVVVLVALVTFGLGLLATLPLLIVLAIVFIIFMIQGTIAASQGRPFRYPLTIRFVR